MTNEDIIFYFFYGLGVGFPAVEEKLLSDRLVPFPVNGARQDVYHLEGLFASID